MTRYRLSAYNPKRKRPERDALALEPGDLEVVVACARELGRGVLLDLEPERLASARSAGWTSIMFEVEPARDIGRMVHSTPATVERYLAALRAMADRVPEASRAAWQRLERALTDVQRKRHGLYFYEPPR